MGAVCLKGGGWIQNHCVCVTVFVFIKNKRLDLITSVCVKRRGAEPLLGVLRMELWADRCEGPLLFFLLLLLLFYDPTETLLFSVCLPHFFALVPLSIPTLLFFLLRPFVFPHPHLRPTAVVQLLPPPAVFSQGGRAVCPGPQTHVRGEEVQHEGHPALCPVTGHPNWCWGSGGGGAGAAAKLDEEQEENSVNTVSLQSN